jgi:hypothetical protein
VGAAHSQDISSVKLCSFDFDVSSSRIGFPDQVVETAPGIKEWRYSRGRTLVFSGRYLITATAEDGQTRHTGDCPPALIEVAAKDFQIAQAAPETAVPVTATKAPVKKKVVVKQAPKHGVRIGMTAVEVLASSWGRPSDINRTTTRYGTREQWVYGSRNYLYFEDGILTAIQN